MHSKSYLKTVAVHKNKYQQKNASFQLYIIISFDEKFVRPNCEKKNQAFLLKALPDSLRVSDREILRYSSKIIQIVRKNLQNCRLIQQE